MGGTIAGLLAAVSGSGQQLHHYIIALVLLPSAAFETRVNLISVRRSRAIPWYADAANVQVPPVLPAVLLSSGDVPQWHWSLGL